MGATSDQLREAIFRTDQELSILDREGEAFRQLAIQAQQALSMPVPLPDGQIATTYSPPSPESARAFSALADLCQERKGIVRWRQDQLRVEMDAAIQNGE